MHVTAPPRKKMTADEFIAWAMERPETEHYELSDGEIVPMAPERVLHNRLKYRVFGLLAQALEQAKLGCEVFGDGVAVQVDSTTVYEPDALVRCGARLGDDDIKIIDPLIIAEVSSPSTSRIDKRDKLAGYFRIASLQHYLVVDAKRRLIVHHRRTADWIETRLVTDGRLRLGPPGIEVANLFPPSEAAEPD